MQWIFYMDETKLNTGIECCKNAFFLCMNLLLRNMPKRKRLNSVLSAFSEGPLLAFCNLKLAVITSSVHRFRANF